MEDAVIKVDNLTKDFKLPREKYSSLKSTVVNIYKRDKTYDIQEALKGISFEVKQGEFFGVVGRNGSGKSTLLKVLAGIYQPTSGSVQVKGKLTPFIELGVGFNPELTGKENVFLNGALLGFSRKEMKELYRDIVNFAELGKFMGQKLKNYSSGMQVRLAFSIAIKTNSDILLLDEVLSVGDAAFQKKCFDYFRRLKKDKKTVVFISHDMNAIREYCDRVVLIEGGKIIEEGNADAVAQSYTKLFMKEPSKKNVVSDTGSRWGSGKAKITKLESKIGDRTVSITVSYKFNSAISEPVFGLQIMNPVGIKVFESNTKWKRYKTGVFKKGSTVKVKWEIENVFTNGDHTVTPAVSSNDGDEFYDHWEEAAVFSIDKDDITTALILPWTKVKID